MRGGCFHNQHPFPLPHAEDACLRIVQMAACIGQLWRSCEHSNASVPDQFLTLLSKPDAEIPRKFAKYDNLGLADIPDDLLRRNNQVSQFYRT
jgi:hypothetical protein